MRFANVIWCGDTYFRGLNGLKTELQQLHFSSPLIRERTYIYIYIASFSFFGSSPSMSALLQALREAESKLAEVTTSGKGPRIGALDSLRLGATSGV